MKEQVNVSYRPLNEKDLALLFNLFQEARFKERYGTDEAFLKESRPEGCYFSIEFGERKQWVGFMSLTDFNQAKDEAWLSIGICPDFWGRGIGTLALQGLIEDCFSVRHMKRLHLFVFATNQHALNLYQKLGFLITAYLPTPFGEVCQLCLENSGGFSNEKQD